MTATMRILMLAVLLCWQAGCDGKQSSASTADIEAAPKAEIRVLSEEVATHPTGPDDRGSGGLAPKSEVVVVPVPDAPDPEAEVSGGLAGDLSIGLSEESLKFLSVPAAAIFRSPVVSKDPAKVTFSFVFDEGRTIRSKMHTRVTTRLEADANSLSWDMVWTELFGAQKGDKVPVKWVLQSLDFQATGASEEYVTVLERALAKLTLGYEVDTRGAISHVERQSEVADQFIPVADALVAGFKQTLVELPREPRGVGGVWTAKSSASILGAATGVSVKYIYRGRVKGPNGQEWAYVDFTLRVGVDPGKEGEGARPKGKGLGRGALLFDLEKGMDVALALRLDLQEEFQAKSPKDAKKERQTVALELVLERSL